VRRLKTSELLRVKRCWKIISEKLRKAGWSCRSVATVDSKGRAIWVVAADREGKRFIVHSDEKLTAFLELQAAVFSALN